MSATHEHRAVSPDRGVVVVGGSLAGLTFALACAGRGMRTRVFERVRGDHPNGGALGIDKELLLDVLGANGRATFNSIPFPVITDYRQAASWQALHRWLRAQVSQRKEIELIFGVAVLEVSQDAGAATALTADGRRIVADVIVGADGYQSVVRRAISPEQPNGMYAGYLLWRGLVAEADLPTGTRLIESNDGAALATDTGYRLVAYPVADHRGSLEPGKRLISFTWYDPSQTPLLLKLGCLSAAGQVLSSLAAENISPTVRAELRGLATAIWPDPWRAAIIHALDNGNIFGTPIAEYFPTRLHRGRLAVLGDAAHVVSPATGKGFVAGVLDGDALAGNLQEAFSRSPVDIPAALSSYEERRLQEAQALANTSIEWSRKYVRGAGDPRNRVSARN